MRIRFASTASVISLFILTAACIDADAPIAVDRLGPTERSSPVSLEELLETIEGGGPDTTDQPDALTRVLDCDPSEDMQQRIREAEETLRELRKRYSERHPEIASANRTLEESIREALEGCAAGFF